TKLKEYASLKEMTMTQVIEQYIDRISLDKAQAD
ncbi:CopG family transcriptional regulator, partial [Cyanobacterium aponinum IPPAS B-1201]